MKDDETFRNGGGMIKGKASRVVTVSLLQRPDTN